MKVGASFAELNTKVYLAMSQHYDVIKDWKSLARALGLTEADISDIEYKCHLGGESVRHKFMLFTRRPIPPSLGANHCIVNFACGENTPHKF